jgi:predicted AAA+ superfamily ATPase
MHDQALYPRRASDAVQLGLKHTPAVLLAGARQTGKTTLATRLAAGPAGAELATLDDAATLALARRDPDGFLEALGPRAVIDEVQRAPGLLPAIRRSILRDPRPGRFLLIASASPVVMTDLAGWPRGLLETVPLDPLSQGEIRRVTEGFVDAVFTGDPPTLAATPREAAAGGAESRDELIAAALMGGYPRVQALGFERRAAWFRSYVTTLLDRDVRDLAQVADLAPMPQLLGLLAARSSGLLNAAGLSRDVGVPNTSLRRYLGLLEMAHLAIRVPAWTAAVGKRLVKAPKLFLCDSGLMAHLALVTEERLAHDAGLAAPLLETFAVMELLKQAGWSRTRPKASHFRTESGHEVDLVLESADGGIVGVDVRPVATIGAADLRGLGTLRDVAGRRFRRGVLLYLGREVMRLEGRLWAVPLSGLWADGPGWVERRA